MISSPYLPSTIPISQVLAIGTGLFGTMLVCTLFMSFITNRFVHPLMHPAVWVAIIFSLIFGHFCLDTDMHIADDNQQAYLSKRGVKTKATIVAVKQTSRGRHLNTRYTWAQITCKFTDNQGRRQQASTTEGYNHIY